jgi:YegS/Rv2252/BmrU family lipid kinase
MLVFNPAAGQMRLRRQIDEVVQYLKGQGWDVDLRITEKRGDATRFAREAVASNYDMVVVAGGDGTNNEVINGDLVGSRVVLGIIPVGTTNVFALEVGIPVTNPLYVRPILDSARVLVEGRVRRIDVGRAGERYFLLMGGVGLDAEVGTHVQPEAKRRFGPLAYVPASLIAAKSFAGTRVIVEMDGERVRDRAILITVNNTRLYGGVVQMAPKACLDDGLLDVCIFRGRNATQAFFSYILGVLFRRHIYDPRVRYHQARRIIIRSARHVPVHVDDEPLGNTPVEFTVATRALRVVLPRAVPGDLLVHGDEN